ncbi:MAG: TetR/AcrR family transcriptional regulator [Aristaeellaceae bacterium]
MTRTVKEPDVRKQEILDGAIRVFAGKGYDRTTIADIAKELHISQGLCYRYYPSKEAIYDAALEKYADLIAQENLRKINYDMPIRELIDSITSRMQDLKAAEREDQGLYQLFHSENSQRMHDELFLRVAKKIIPCVQEHLRRAGEKGEITIEDTDSAAIIGIYGWVGMFLTKGLTDEERMERIRLAWYKLLEL